MHGLTGYKSRKLKSIVDRVPFEWKTKISASPKFYVTVKDVEIQRSRYKYETYEGKPNEQCFDRTKN